VRDATLRKRMILRPQPHAVPERTGVLERTEQDLRVLQRDVGLRERDAARFRQLAHFGQRLAGEADGERADRIDVRLAEEARAMLQHLDEPRLVERRIGVGRAGETRDAAGRGGRELGFERRLVLEPRLAQPRGEVDEAGTDDAARRVDDVVGPPLARHVAGAGHDAVGDVQIGAAIDALRGIDEAAIADRDVHGVIGLPSALRAAG
jgi:hypothetical protein